jgi:hypothetical protein
MDEAPVINSMINASKGFRSLCIFAHTELHAFEIHGVGTNQIKLEKLGDRAPPLVILALIVY